MSFSSTYPSKEQDAEMDEGGSVGGSGGCGMSG